MEHLFRTACRMPDHIVGDQIPRKSALAASDDASPHGMPLMKIKMQRYRQTVDISHNHICTLFNFDSQMAAVMKIGNNGFNFTKEPAYIIKLMTELK